MKNQSKMQAIFIDWMKDKATYSSLKVSYLEPSEHIVMVGHLVGYTDDQWLIQATSSSVPNDWEDREDYLNNPCHVDMYDFRQLVVIGDKEGNFLLDKAKQDLNKKT